jgi:hypothetical protein
MIRILPRAICAGVRFFKGLIIDRKGDGHLMSQGVGPDGAVECDRCPGVLGVEGLGGLGPVEGAVDGAVDGGVDGPVDGAVDGANLNRPCPGGPAKRLPEFRK